MTIPHKDEINVYIVDLPHEVHECVRENIDNTYTVIVNARDCREKQDESVRHALSHIEQCDFDKIEMSVNEIESHRHAG